VVLAPDEEEAENLLARFLDHLPIGVFVVDSAGRPFYANAASEKLLGRGATSEVGPGELAEAYQAYVAGTDEAYPTNQMPLLRALEGDTSTVDDMEISRPDARVPIQVWAGPMYDRSGNLAYAIAAFQDVSERRQAEGASRASEERFRAAFDHAPIGVALLSVDGCFVEVNPAMCEITGLSAEAILGKSFQAITHPDDLQADLALMDRLVAGEIASYRLEKRYVRPDGSSVWVLLARSLVTDAHDDRFFVVQAEDISARKAFEDQLVQRSLHDDLTGLPNRALLRDRLRHGMAQAERQGAALAVLYLDLDGFKAVNDRLGHAAGDELLIEVAKRLGATLRTSDTAARVGGDEFVVLCEFLRDDEEADKVSERIALAVARPSPSVELS
jgi:diguanylate cyclase (GGDEF)-like protein/PAS domain S-box-containing protein